MTYDDGVADNATQNVKEDEACRLTDDLAEDLPHDEAELTQHSCPFEAPRGESESDSERGPWILLVTDRNGTYHGISELRVVALTGAEVEELEAWNTGLLDDCAGFPLVELLKKPLHGYADLEWT